MRVGHRLSLCQLFLAIALGVAACASTKVVATWTDPQFRGHGVRSLLVVARVEDESLRRSFEDRFATALQDRGIKALASYRVAPEAAGLEKETFEASASGIGAEGILIARLLGEERVEIWEPLYGLDPYDGRFPGWPHRGWPYHRDWPYPGFGYGYPYEPMISRQATLIHVEANLYTTAGPALVWSARTETLTFESTEEKIGEVAKRVVRQMIRDDLI
jgi:hypothetical protein